MEYDIVSVQLRLRWHRLCCVQLNVDPGPGPFWCHVVTPNFHFLTSSLRLSSWFMVVSLVSVLRSHICTNIGSHLESNRFIVPITDTWCGLPPAMCPSSARQDYEWFLVPLLYCAGRHCMEKVKWLYCVVLWAVQWWRECGVSLQMCGAMWDPGPSDSSDVNAGPSRQWHCSSCSVIHQ